MTALRIIRRFRELRDVTFGSPADGDVVTYDAGSDQLTLAAPSGGGGGGTDTLADVLARGADADAIEITNAADPTADSSLDTRGSRNSAISALSSVYQPLDSDLTAIAALSTTTFGRAVLAFADAAALRSAAGLGTAATSNTGDFDAAGAATAAQAASQPLDSDLTAIAVLSTTSFGRALLALADAAALRTAAGLGTASTHAATDFDTAGAAAAAQAASQPLDSDLTAIAALTTTSFGRALLALADAAALRTDAGLVIGTDVEAHDTDLTTIAGLTPTNDDVLQRKAGAWTNRTMAQLISDLGGLGTTFQPLDSDLTSIAALSTTSYGRGLLTAANGAGIGLTASDVGALAATAAAGGDLTGNYPNPTIGAAKVTVAKLAAAVTLDAIAAANATAADWSNNSHKITSVSNGTLAQDAAAFGQLGNVLGVQVYAPGSRTTTGVTNTALTAFDATNLTVSFTAPLSGNVLLTFCGIVDASTTATLVNIGWLDHTAHTAVANVVEARPPNLSGAGDVMSFTWRVTGLTPGAALQYDLGGAAATGITVNVISYGTNSDVTTNPGAPTMLLVQRA